MEGSSGGVGVRRAAESANLRDLLGFKPEENDSNGGDNQRHSNNYNNTNNRNLVGLTLGAVLSGEMRSLSMPVRSNRTLLDIIRDEPLGKNGRADENRRWRLLKQKLKLGRARTAPGSALTSLGPVPATTSNNNESNSTRVAVTRRHSADVLPNPGSTVQQAAESSASASAAASASTSLSSVMIRSSSAPVPPEERNPSPPAQSGERGTNEAGGSEGGEAPGAREESSRGGEEEQQPARMSLMALLEETDRQMGLDVPGYTMNDDDDDDDEHEEMEVFLDAEPDPGEGGAEAAAVGITSSCCVCMVRHKGAAFIPCGHTFCRLCSRELWVRRGNCPLCNNLILEILDIF